MHETIRNGVIDHPGLSSRDLFDRLELPPERLSHFRVGISRLLARGEIVRIHKKFFPSEDLIYTGGRRVPRPRIPVRVMGDGRIRVLGHTLRRPTVRNLIKQLEEKLSCA